MVVLLLACGRTPLEFEISPQPLDLGVVDFPAEMPDDGYARGNISLANVGEDAGVLTLPEYDTEVFCIDGLTTQAFPAPMGTVEPGSTYVLDVGICGYTAGSAGTELTASFEVWTDGDPDTLVAEVVFTPNRITD